MATLQSVTRIMTYDNIMTGLDTFSCEKWGRKMNRTHTSKKILFELKYL